ncbi:MAG: fused MFS/spermidine synthase [Desulfobacteraceae bacterium]
MGSTPPPARPQFRGKITPTLVLFYGAAALAAQVLFLREFLVLAQGNELQLGLGLWAWLIWTGLGSLWGGRLASSRIVAPATLAGWLGVLGGMLPATMILTRILPGLLHLPLGQVLPPFQAGLLFLTLLAPFCLISGLFFPLACQSLKGSQTWGTVGRVYFLDTLGAALGVGFLQLLLIGRIPSLELALGLGLILNLLALLAPPARRRTRRWIMAGLGLLILGGLLTQASRLEDWSRGWQWPGQNLVAVQESPYGLLSASQAAEQVNFFENNLWYFSYPDPLTAEARVQYALLQHSHPRRVLLIGGGVGGAVAQILKTPGLTNVDYVELDPQLIRLARRVLPPVATQPLQEPRVRLIYQDGRRFIKNTDSTYDVILLCLPEPKNALLNRFYSLEFFQEVKARLRPAGVFSFALTGAEVSLSPLRAQYLGLAYHTLQRVFPEVRVFPGLTVRFFASPRSGQLVTDPAILVSRLQARQLRLYYVREYYLYENLSPSRQAYLQQILAQTDPGLNTDLFPQCYFYDLVLSWAQEVAVVKDLLVRLRPLPFWSFPVAVVLATLGLWWRWRCPKEARTGSAAYRSAPYLYNIMIMGLSAMALEITLVILFQIQMGFLYGQLGLLMAAFMFGMGLGSGLTPRLIASQTGAWRWSLAFQGGTVLLAGLLSLTLPNLLKLPLLSWEGWAQAGFAMLLGSVGLLAGGVFASQAELLQQIGTELAVSAGLLYAMDLVGATLGTLGMGLMALPLWGLQQTLLLLAVFNLSALIILYTAGRPHPFPPGANSPD